MKIPAQATNQSVYFELTDAVTGGPYTTTGGETDINLIYQIHAAGLTDLLAVEIRR